MSLNTTTNTVAVGQQDTSIVVSSATGAAVGNYLVIDQEVMQITKAYDGTATTIPVTRGLDGSVQTTHVKTANVTFYKGSDEAVAAANFVQFPKVRGRDVLSYIAAGAITLPNIGNDMIAMLNSTSVLAMTLAAPTKDMDGSILTVIGNGKAAHTLSLPAGVGLGAGGSGVDVGTFASGAQQAVVLMAANGVWVPYGSFMGGTSLANVTVTWA